MINLVLLITLPFIAAILLIVASLVIPRQTHIATFIHLSASITLWGIGFTLLQPIQQEQSISAGYGLLRVDALSLLMIMLISGVGVTTGLYMIHYANNIFNPSVNDGNTNNHHYSSPPTQKYRPWGSAHTHHFYARSHLFIGLLLLAVSADNLALFWVAVTGALLSISILLNQWQANSLTMGKYLHNYLVLTFVTMIPAFISTVMTALAGQSAAGSPSALNWSLLGEAQTLSEPVIRVAFIFALVGYGTLCGIAPVQTWLTTTATIVPTPINALIGGGLVNVGIYAIVRFKALADTIGDPTFSQRALLGLGILSLVAATVSLLIQRDPRLLPTYLSMTHVGIICLGLGFGEFWGAFGAFLHLINHTLGISLLWLVISNIKLAYKHTTLHHVRGLIQTHPLTGGLLLISALTLIGLPPFGFFLSLLFIFGTGLVGSAVWVAMSGIILLVIIFSLTLGIIHRMLYGTAPPERAIGEKGQWFLAPLACNIGMLLLFGITIPPQLAQILASIAKLLNR